MRKKRTRRSRRGAGLCGCGLPLREAWSCFFLLESEGRYQRGPLAETVAEISFYGDARGRRVPRYGRCSYGGRLVDGESVSALYLVDGVGTKQFKLLRLDSAEGDDRDARWALAFAGSSLVAMPCTNACVIFSGDQQWVRERRVVFGEDLYPRAPLCCAVDEHRIACSDGDSVVVLDATTGAFLKEHRTFLEEKRAEEKRPWRITNVGCTHNKISVVLDASGEGYNDGAAYVMDADGTEVERLGVEPKKKRVVLTTRNSSRTTSGSPRARRGTTTTRTPGRLRVARPKRRVV